MRTALRLVFASFALTAGGCQTGVTDTAESRMLDRRSDEGWVETDAGTTEGRLIISDELARARSAVAATTGRGPAAVPQQEEPRRATTRPVPPLQPWPGAKLSIVFDDAPLRDVVAAVAAEMKINVIIPTGLAEPVSVNFPAIDPLLGLDALLRAQGKRIHYEKDVLTVVELEKSLFAQAFRVTSNRAFDPDTLVKPLLTPDGSLVYDADQRRMTVTDSSDALDRIEAFMKAADRRTQQVLIEAVIIEVRRGRDSSHGAALEALDVDFSNGYHGTVSSLLGSAATTAGTKPFTFGLVNTDEMIQFVLSARKGKTKFNILSNPLVAAISGTKAEMKVTERIPYVQSTNTINVGGGGAATNSTQEIQFEEIGVTLTVTPDVGADGIVRMEVVPDIRELVDFILGVPVIDSRKVTSHILVRNNETVVIGGLLRSATRKREDKVPVLSSIPLIGDLFFKRLVEDNERVELLVFVTPHIMGFGAEAVDGYRPQENLLVPGGRLPLIEGEAGKHQGLPTGVTR